MNYCAVAGFILLSAIKCVAQDSLEHQPEITWSAFADVYYAYDFNRPASHEKPFFLYNHNRHNEVTVNLALVRATYNHARLRSSLGLMAGTYAQYNLAAEPLLLRHIYEASIGVKLSSKANVWLDAGIFPSHIGYESAISKDNWALTRSLAAENSPYYESGLKLSFTTKNEKWLLSGLLLNGWQRIRRIDANNTPAFGTQITAFPQQEITVNWSTFTGNDFPDSLRRWRHFHNVYALIQLSEKVGATFGLDAGVEQTAKGSNTWNFWTTPNFILRYQPDEQWAFAFRGEYYQDKNGVIISTGTPHGFKTFGGSLNIDRKVLHNFWWRTEIRTLNSKDAIFTRNNEAVRTNTFITTSGAISF